MPGEPGQAGREGRAGPPVSSLRLITLLYPSLVIGTRWTCWKRGRERQLRTLPTPTYPSRLLSHTMVQETSISWSPSTTPMFLYILSFFSTIFTQFNSNTPQSRLLFQCKSGFNSICWVLSMDLKIQVQKCTSMSYLCLLCVCLSDPSPKESKRSTQKKEAKDRFPKMFPIKSNIDLLFPLCYSYLNAFISYLMFTCWMKEIERPPQIC